MPSNGIGEADRQIVQREDAGRNSYRISHVKVLAWPAAYLLALCRNSDVPKRILLLDNNCLNALQSDRVKERLRANLRATGREFWPTGMNALEAVQISDPDKRIRLLRTLADLAGENLAFPLPEHAVQRVAESIARRSPMIEWADHKLTALFRYPEDLTEQDIRDVREYLLQQEAGFDDVNVRAREEITPVLLEAGGRETWPTVHHFIDDFWSGEAQLGPYATALWDAWGFPESAPISELIRQEPWRLYFDGWGAAAYARMLEHPQRGLVQSADLKQLTYLGAARDRVLVSEDKGFRRLGNLVLRGRYPLAEIVPLSEVIG